MLVVRAMSRPLVFVASQYAVASSKASTVDVGRAAMPCHADEPEYLTVGHLDMTNRLR
ncbi:hypothetical protein M419DRAFT_122670 [Trichoderma reesei RUT C-30]|uniref:Uncharacterized protein n=1 Tax=Hypocrea jecorina (strain ATCC 56765 / BCRC 32924 / NRRL 11460 / Rut C-30) TaxID=1344414 RepID=A0A024SE01_HYPJR|nr:hypothetical protein M419DRAFT_122670 [Trichoderma reesei RUT C-30]